MRVYKLLKSDNLSIKTHPSLDIVILYPGPYQDNSRIFDKTAFSNFNMLKSSFGKLGNVLKLLGKKRRGKMSKIIRNFTAVLAVGIMLSIAPGNAVYVYMPNSGCLISDEGWGATCSNCFPSNPNCGEIYECGETYAYNRYPLGGYVGYEDGYCCTISGWLEGHRACGSLCFNNTTHECCGGTIIERSFAGINPANNGSSFSNSAGSGTLQNCGCL